MPIRIKPVQAFGPCVLTLESIEKITARIERDFPLARYSAVDGAWEIYDEPRASFLSGIAERDTLNSFIAQAHTSPPAPEREIELIFNEREAKLTCKAQPEDEEWFEHFIIDIKKQIGPPTFAQLMVQAYGKGKFDLRILFLAIPVNPSLIISTPYCKIVIRQKPPSPFVENIKANIVSNIIWSIIVFALGVTATYLYQHLVTK